MVRMAFSALFCLIVAVPASAQEASPTAQKQSQAVSPLIDRSTVLVLHVDLARIDPQAAANYVFDLLELPAKEREQAEMAEIADTLDVLDEFRKAGATDIYVVIGTDFNFLSLPDMVVSTKAGQAEAMKSFLQERPGTAISKLTFVVAGDNVCLGASEKVKAYAENAGRLSKPLARVFDEGGNAAGHVIAVLSAETRDKIRETAPPLPPEISEASVGELADALKYAVLAVDLPPQPKLKLTLQASDAAGAKLLSTTITNSLKLLQSAPVPSPDLAELKEILPVEKMVKMLTPRIEEDKVILAIGENKEDVEIIRTAISEAANKARDAAERSRYANNFKQIGLAMHNYHDVFAKFPAPANLDKAGKPLLSWRVHILPFLEQNALYDQFHLNEPWDSEHNKKLIEKMPDLYGDARIKELKPGMTTVLAPIGAKTIWAKKEGSQFRDITDGTSNTVMVLQGDAEHAVIWSKPDDLLIDPKKPTTGLFQVDGQFMMSFCDGSVRMLPATLDAKVMNAILTASGGEVVELP